MKLLIFVILTTFSFGLTAECEKATTEATRIHWSYISGDKTVSKTDSYNAAAKMKKICGDKR